MKIIRTANHVTMTAEITDPKYICISECKKVWWNNDMHIEASIVTIPNCPMCGGLLKIATKKDYERIN